VRMNPLAQDVEKNLARNNLSKLEETSLTENLENVLTKKLISKETDV